MAPKCPFVLQPVSSTDHAPHCYCCSAPVTYIWSFYSFHSEENTFEVFENQYSTIVVPQVKPLFPLLPLPHTNHLSVITFHSTSSIICFENHHLLIFCSILHKLKSDCFSFLQVLFLWENTLLLLYAYFLSLNIQITWLRSRKGGRRDTHIPSAP